MSIEPHSSPGLALLQVAASRGASIEELEKWMALHERWEANEARKAYIKAMAAFKSKVITVEKSAHVSFANKTGQNTEYDHETLWDVVAAAVPRMGEYGLAHTWDVVQAEGAVTVSCIVTHEQGHSEKVTMSSPRDESGGKNTIQSIGSATTYLQRYTLKAALGLASKERDDDGRGASPPAQFISVDQQTEINDMIKERVHNPGKFLDWLKAPSVAEIPAKDYARAKAELQRQPKKAAS
jgi:ERF superfamily